MNVLVTGTAGFIGFYLVQKLLNAGHTVYGIDSINHYYDVTLKHDRLHACGIDHPVPGKEIVSSRNTNYTFCQSYIIRHTCFRLRGEPCRTSRGPI